MAWEMWWAVLGAATAISVSPGEGAIQSIATGLAGKYSTEAQRHDGQLHH
jgi:hypothetical protein